MNIGLTRRTAIVTGFTAGFGRATAEGLARAGVTVIINGRTQARVEESVREMREAFPDRTITGIAADPIDRGGRRSVHPGSAGRRHSRERGSTEVRWQEPLGHRLLSPAKPIF